MTTINNTHYSSYTGYSSSLPTTQRNTDTQTAEHSDTVILSLHSTDKDTYRPYDAQGRVKGSFLPPDTTTTSPSSDIKNMMQAMLDKRIGFDREKWEELQKEIEALQALENPTEADLKKLETLTLAQQEIAEQAARKLQENSESQKSHNFTLV